MAISIDDELLSLPDAAKILPGRPHVATLFRWHKRGVRGVRLATVLIAGRRYTSRAALDEFVAATTAAADGSAPPIRTPRKREAAIRRAERDLGIS